MMKDGRVIESGATDAILNQPKDAYTQYLISAKKKINEHFERVMRGEIHAKSNQC